MKYYHPAHKFSFILLKRDYNTDPPFKIADIIRRVYNLRLVALITVGVHMSEKAQRAHVKSVKRRSHSFFVRNFHITTEA